MGGAQPLAASFAGATSLTVEVDPERIKKRLETGYVDELAENLNAALERVHESVKGSLGRSIALCGNMATVIHEILELKEKPDIVTDQTSAHDPLIGYIPEGYSPGSGGGSRSFEKN